MSVICSCILQIAVLLYGVSGEYHFSIQPRDIDAIEGMAVELQCKVLFTSLEGQNYSLHWQFNTSTVRELHPNFIVKGGKVDGQTSFITSSLTITNISKQDKGLYSCYLNGNSGLALITSNNAKMTVISKPRFLRKPKNVTAIEGYLAIIRCRIEAIDSDVMSVTWTRGGEKVALSDATTATSGKRGYDPRYSVVGDNVKAYHLEIRKVRQSDAGTFYCNFHLNMSGEVILRSPGAKLDVLFPPDESYPSCSTAESKNYSAGDTLTTECISSGGNGPLRLSWIRNGEEINGTRVDNKYPDTRDTWTLTAEDNGGNITCVMKGKAVLNRRQCVIGPLNVHFGPVLSIEPRATQMSIGQSVTFKCSADANPPITTMSYSWFLNDEQLNQANSEFTIDWKDIHKQKTSMTMEINVTCTANVAYTKISDTAVVKMGNHSIRTDKTISKKSSALPTSILYTAVGCVSVLLAIFLLLCFVYLTSRLKKENDNKPHSLNNTPIDAKPAFTYFHTSNPTFGLQYSPGGNDDDECSYSSDFYEISRLNRHEESSSNEYENVDEKQKDQSCQSLTESSSGLYINLNERT